MQQASIAHQHFEAERKSLSSDAWNRSLTCRDSFRTSMLSTRSMAQESYTSIPD